MRLARELLDDGGAFCTRFGVRMFPHQAEALAVATARRDGRFLHRLAGVSWPRGDGKSFLGAIVGVWRLVAGPPRQDIISVALDLDGTQVILEHARQIIRSSPELDRAVEIRANAILVPATGSRWTIGSREHTNTRGRHPTVVIYDEPGWAKDDELFSSLLAGQASVADPLMLVVSTVGRRQAGPLWTVKALAEAGDSAVSWQWSGTNRSPLVTPEFLERQRRILLPAAYAREHQNLWVDAADAFTSSAEVDAAMFRGFVEQFEGRRDIDAVVGVDLGVVHDAAVIALGYREGGLDYVGRLVTFQGSHERPVQLADVEATILDLVRQWPRVRKIQIESWQGVASVQRLQEIGLPVEVFTPTAKAHAEQWPLLAQRLASRTLVLPPHARLREELLNLTVEIGPQGARVIDKGGIHQDHAVAVRLAVAMLSGAGCGFVTFYRDRYDAAHPVVAPPADASEEDRRVLEHQRCRVLPPRLRPGTYDDGPVSRCLTCKAVLGPAGVLPAPPEAKH